MKLRRRCQHERSLVRSSLRRPPGFLFRADELFLEKVFLKNHFLFPQFFHVESLPLDGIMGFVCRSHRARIAVHHEYVVVSVYKMKHRRLVHRQRPLNFTLINHFLMCLRNINVNIPCRTARS